jgi:DNA modification methylase
MTTHYQDDHLTVHVGDCRDVLASLPAESVHCVVTSPPYWGLRDYGEPGQLGLESTPDAYVANMVAVFREVRRVLRADGTVWLNLGDSYYSQGGHTGQGSTSQRQGRSNVGAQNHDNGRTGGKPKDLVGIPWRVAFALQADGWYLRSDVIWSKPNPMPESVTDRPTKAHEYLFLLTRSATYFYDAEAVREAAPLGRVAVVTGRGLGKETGKGHAPQRSNSGGFPSAGRNLRSVWSIATEPYPGAHFATFPQKLVEPCIKAGTSERGVCPECGAPWVREVERGEDESRVTGRGLGKEAGKHHGRAQRSNSGGFKPLVTLLGWRPSCGHQGILNRGELDAEAVDWDPIPATVLDPFAGSGTTGLVANRLGRRAILIDLSADYIDQAMLRNQQHPLGLIG